VIVNNLMFKLKKRDDETIAKVQDILLSMKGKIEFLCDIEVHPTIRKEPISYDLMMVTKYNSFKDFEGYVAHPAHVEVGKKIHDLVDSIAAVMYESK
jgi:hypothetical protein